MTNELTQDAEGSETIEETAVDQTESTTATAETVDPTSTDTAEMPAETSPEASEETPSETIPVPAEGAANEGVSLDADPVTETETVAEATVVESVPAVVSEPTVADAPVEETEAPVADNSASAAEPPAPVASTPHSGSAISGPGVTIRTVKAPAPIAKVVEAPAPVSTDEAASATEATDKKTDAPAQEFAVAKSDDDIPADIDFGAILEQFEQEQIVFHQGELVEGKVVGITDRGVLVDFGYKSEGFVPVEEFTDANGEMTAKVGDDVEVTIRTMHSGDAAPQLSRVDAVGRKVWDDIEAAFNAETPVIGRVVDKTKGGLRVDINGIEAFLPGSQIDSRPIRSLDTYIGQDIEAKIIKFSRRRNNIVLSRKVITDLVVNEQKAETLSKIEIGHIVFGSIKNLTEYGAFVDIGGIDGLLHVTDMSWGRIHHPGDQFKVGEQLQVKVLKLDREKEKVSLGYKQLLPDPWSTVVEVYPVNTKLTGIVSSVTEYGVFVELEAGVEGLVHVSEITWSRRSQSPKRMFNKGQEVEVQVLGVDTVEKRISLGMKQFQENPWDMVDIKYPVGSKIIGKVRNLTDFGAFIELEEGIDGLVHVSDISWAKKIKHPKDVLKKDQEVEAIVTSIDKRGQRLSLSMKDLTPSAWEGFVATHRPGDVVRGKVSRFTNFGVFVELGDGLEGLCHISELSDERVENAESIASLGQEMDFKILRIEPVDQKIGLSHRAVGKVDEPVADTRMYSTEAKGGMASLGELAKLRFGGDAEPETPAVEDPEEKRRAKLAAKEAKTKEFAAKEAAAAEAAEAEAAAEAARAEAEVAAEPAAETDSPSAEVTGEVETETDSTLDEAVTEENIPEEDTPGEGSTNVEATDDDAKVAETVEESEPLVEPSVEASVADTEAAVEGEDVPAQVSAVEVETIEPESPAPDVDAEVTTPEENVAEEAIPDDVPNEETEKKSA